MNTLQRYIFKEIFPVFILGNVLLVTLLLLEKLVSLADLFFTKNVPGILIAQTIVFYLPSFLMITIPTATLMACLIGFGRLSADSEVIVMRTTGAGPMFFLKPAIALGLAAFIAGIAISTYLMPKGSSLAVDNLAEIAKTISINDMKEKQMYDEVPGMLFYADEKTGQDSFKNLVIIDRRSGSIVSAGSGRITPSDEAGLVMELQNGRIVGTSERSNHSVINFGELGANLGFDVRDKFNKRYEYFMYLDELKANFGESPTFAFEYSKRFALPFSAVIMSVFGMSLGIFFQRSGRSVGIPVSLLLLTVYYILFFVALNLVRSGKLEPFSGAWLSNILFAAVTLFTLRRVLK
ncbi:LptF/LptG family permease [Limisalsivibrio acetivorans]|uniref:LptF/LptG family permease n=1 Tax=Limisalsivibrio acetivorans TaxID=1304888 RepID=UPI0003B6DDAD|nr:LptF/LptG family permease [Limisalsivibrio acetivorans]